MSPREQIEFMEGLATIYFDNMEGCELLDFLKWETLYVAACEIRDAMKEDLRPPQSYP